MIMNMYNLLFKPKGHYITIRNDNDYPTKVSAK